LQKYLEEGFQIAQNRKVEPDTFSDYEPGVCVFFIPFHCKGNISSNL